MCADAHRSIKEEGSHGTQLLLPLLFLAHSLCACGHEADTTSSLRPAAQPQTSGSLLCVCAPIVLSIVLHSRQPLLPPYDPHPRPYFPASVRLTPSLPASFLSRNIRVHFRFCFYWSIYTHSFLNFRLLLGIHEVRMKASH